jgi:hypothetical protein
VSYFDSIGLARKFAEESKKAGWHQTEAFEKSERPDEGHALATDTLQRVLGAIKAKELPKGARAQVEETLRDLYFATLDEQNARTSGLRRRNRAGYDPDMMRSFLASARSMAGFLANMEHGGTTNELFVKMQREAAASPDRQRGQEAFNAFAAHYVENLKRADTPMQDRLMALTSIQQLATNPAYHLQNLTQPVMVTLPRLAADAGDYTGAWRALLAGYGVVRQAGVFARTA